MTMTHSPPNTHDKKGENPRTEEDVPFFPFSPVRMEQGSKSKSSVAEAQFDFVSKSGRPATAADSNQDEQGQ
jgi:hypothetical protein